MLEAISERLDQEERTRLRELAFAACVPHLDERSRREYFASLDKARELPQDMSIDEQAAENRRAKEFFSQLQHV